MAELQTEISSLQAQRKQEERAKIKVDKECEKLQARIAKLQEETAGLKEQRREGQEAKASEMADEMAALQEELEEERRAKVEALDERKNERKAAEKERARLVAKQQQQQQDLQALNVIACAVYFKFCICLFKLSDAGIACVCRPSQHSNLRVL